MEVTALLLGLAGSLHCAGMCSPLSQALISRIPDKSRGFLLYHFGRILTYSLLGAFLTLFGFLFQLTTWQNTLSLLLGSALLILGILGVTGFRIPLVTQVLERFTIWLKIRFSAILQRRNRLAYLGLGLINGFLPCGVSYLALTYTLTLRGPFDGFLFMFLFGLGTLPVMVGIQPIFQWISRTFRYSPGALTRFSWILIGALLIARVYLNHSHEVHQASTFVETICAPL